MLIEKGKVFLVQQFCKYACVQDPYFGSCTHEILASHSLTPSWTRVDIWAGKKGKDENFCFGNMLLLV